MNLMRQSLVLTAIVLAACAQTASPTTTASPLDTAPPQNSTTVPNQDYAIQGCESPPVSFSALCEIHELVHEWHVDRPIDDALLADVAIQALDNYVGIEKAPRPRTLQCVAPSPEFERFCIALAGRVLESGIAIAPAIDNAVVAMADIGLDPFSYYVPPEQVGSLRSNGVVGGVGVLLDATNAVGSKCAQIAETCPLEIVFVVEDNPAAVAGLLAGDVIVAVDGNPTAELRTGSPYTVIENTNRSNTFSNSQRPNIDGAFPEEQSAWRNNVKGETFFNTSVFSSPGAGLFGNSPRNFCCGPGLVNFDISVHKWFNFTEQLRMQFRADFYNMTNTPAFANPEERNTRGGFGRVSSTLRGTGGRVTQLALRIEF